MTQKVTLTEEETAAVGKFFEIIDTHTTAYTAGYSAGMANAKTLLVKALIEGRRSKGDSSGDEPKV